MQFITEDSLGSEYQLYWLRLDSREVRVPRIGLKPLTMEVAMGSVLLALIAGPALADTAPAPVDVSRLSLAHDGKGHYMAYRVDTLPDGSSDFSTAKVFLGSRQLFYEVPYKGWANTMTGVVDFIFWEPRNSTRKVAFGPSIVVTCGKHETSLLRVPAKEAQQILRKAKFRPPLWTRSPVALGRDAVGNYYYVDNSRDPERRYDYRLYIGRRSKLKQRMLVDAVNDDAGTLLVAKDGGTLRLGPPQPNGKVSLEWGNPKKKMETLTQVDGASTVSFIYNDLGVYLGAKLGTPCDYW